MTKIYSLSLGHGPQACVLAYSIETRTVRTTSTPGTLGRVYEILAAGASRPDGAPTLRLRALKIGEALDYPLTAILYDPREG
jgi:hypothetical protein